MTNIFNSPLVLLWWLKTNSTLFYDFDKIEIWLPFDYCVRLANLNGRAFKTQFSKPSKILLKNTTHGYCIYWLAVFGDKLIYD